MAAKNILPLLLYICYSSQSQAQIKAVVIDMESGLPLRDVTVTVDNSYIPATTTNYTGTFTVKDSAEEITLGHIGYETRHLLRHELTDTIGLMHKFMAIREVVIYGQLPTIGFNLKSSIKSVTADAPRQGGMTFDFASMFSWKKRKRTEERLKAIEHY